VQPAVTATVLDELGSWLTGPQNLPTGPIPDGDRNKILSDCVGYYFRRICEIVSSLSPDGLIEYLVSKAESLLYEDAVERESLAYRVACFGDPPDLADEIDRGERDRAEAAIASRFLIEYVAATPPTGRTKITLDIYDHLIAVAAELYSRASLSDAILYGFSEAKLSILESGRLGVSRGDRYEAGTKAFRASYSEAIRRMVTDPQPALTSVAAQPSEEVESAMLKEFGFTLGDLRSAIGELIALGDAFCGYEPYRLPEEQVRAQLMSRLGWSSAKVEGFIDRLSLQERVDFLSVKADAYPWRYNREWSYARRPLIRVGGLGGPSFLVWAPRQCWSAGGYWTGLIYSGRMRAQSKELRTIVSTIRQHENLEFERSVAAAFQAGGCDISVAGLSKICGSRLQSSAGDDLGDIDALGIRRDKRLILVGEAKDFELARTPRELAHEVDHLLEGERSALRKLTARAGWVRGNLARVLKHFELEDDLAGWSIVPVIVTSRNLISPHFFSSKVPVIPIDEAPLFVKTTINRARGYGRRQRKVGRRRG
jgi:hypothetical protein